MVLPALRSPFEGDSVSEEMVGGVRSGAVVMLFVTVSLLDWFMKISATLAVAERLLCCFHRRYCR